VANFRDLLADMESNPSGDWRIADIARVCEGFGIRCEPPTGGGSHFKVSCPGVHAILTVPSRRPLKPVYVRKFTAFVRAARSERN
jgi:hypothetical protein